MITKLGVCSRGACRPNHHLHFHHPALYLPTVQQIFRNPPLDINVQVLREALPGGDGVRTPWTKARRWSEGFSMRTPG